MKHYFLLAFLVFSGITQSAKANLANDFIGSWSVNGQVFSNGKKIGNATGTSRVSRFGKRGFYAVATSRVGALPAATGYAWLYDNGTVSGYFVQSGKTVGNMSGSWSISGKKLTQKLKVFTANVNYTQTTTLTWINRKRIDGVSTTNTGLRITGIQRKK
jgi:hypothetical protein